MMKQNAKTSETERKIHMADLSNNTAFMYKYLQYVVQFEKYVYVWTNAMNAENKKLQNIYDNRTGYDNAIQQAVSDKDYSISQAQKNKQSRRNSRRRFLGITAFIVIDVALMAILYFGGYDTDYIGLTALLLGWALLAELIAFIKYKDNRKKVAMSKKYNLLGSSDEIIDARKQAAENYKLVSVDEEKKIQKKQSEIFTELNDAKKNLADIYSNNVLPVKYRNFCAAATLLGYLKDGRCTTIKGHGGIYDTYENDVKANIIITRLTEIRDSVLRIEANQQILVQEMQSANRMLNSIQSSVNSIDNTTKQIERNTAVSAIADQQTAAAASYIAYMEWARS